MSVTGRRWPAGLDVAVPFIIVTLIWGSTWLVIRDQVSSVPPSWSVAYRFAVAGIAMLILALVQGLSLRLSAPALRLALFLGVSQFMLNFNFVYRSEMFVTSGVVAVLYALLLIPNSLMGWAFFRQPVSRGFVLGSIISTLGIGLLFVHEYRISTIDPDKVLLGILLGLGGLLSASCANVVQMTETARRTPMPSLLAFAMLFGAALDALWALATEGPPVIDLRPGYIGGVLYLALAGSVVTFPLYYRLIQKIGAGRAAYSSVLIPVIAMLLSTLFEGYRWSGLSVAGAVLALGGMVIALRTKSAGQERG